MSKICMVSGKRSNAANNVSHSNRKTRRVQNANLAWKRFWDAENNRWVRLRVSTKVMKTVSRDGLKRALRVYQSA